MQKRIEIAHYWQDCCLAIEVRDPARPGGLFATIPAVAASLHILEPGHERWLDLGESRVRLRCVIAEAALPRRRTGIAGATGFAGLLLCALLMSNHALSSTGARPTGWRSIERIVVHGSPCCDDDRGIVVSITNDSGQLLWTRCSDPTVNVDGALSPGEHLLAVPESIPGCRFHDGYGGWTYGQPFSTRDGKRQRRFGFQRDDCDPYLFFLEIADDYSLKLEGDQKGTFPRLPLEPQFKVH